jgi:hypothetical protein
VPTKPDSTESPLLSAAWRKSGAEPNLSTTAIAFQKLSVQTKKPPPCRSKSKKSQKSA